MFSWTAEGSGQDPCALRHSLHRPGFRLPTAGQATKNVTRDLRPLPIHHSSCSSRMRGRIAACSERLPRCEVAAVSPQSSESALASRRGCVPRRKKTGGRRRQNRQYCGYFISALTPCWRASSTAACHSDSGSFVRPGWLLRNCFQLALQLRDWFWNGCAFTLHDQPHLGD
jgi:hypothetical protein